MKNEDTTEIASLADGSIDYHYYAARASMARHTAVKGYAGKLLETPAGRRPGISVLAAVVLLVIIL